MVLLCCVSLFNTYMYEHVCIIMSIVVIVGFIVNAVVITTVSSTILYL